MFWEYLRLRISASVRVCARACVDAHIPVYLYGPQGRVATFPFMSSRWPWPLDG